MAAAAAAENTFDPHNIFLVLAHGSDPGKHRFFVKPNHHLLLPQRCGTTIDYTHEHIRKFFTSDYSSVKVPQIETKLLNIERLISPVGSHTASYQPIKHKLYRSEFRNANPELSINEASGRFTTPDVDLQFLRLLMASAAIIRIDVSGIYRQTIHEIGWSKDIDPENNSKLEYAKVYRGRTRKLNTVRKSSVDMFTRLVFGTADMLNTPIAELKKTEAGANILKEVRRSLQHSLMTFNKLKIIAWHTKNNSPLSAEMLIDLSEGDLHLGDIDNITLNEIKNTKIPLSFLMDFIELKVHVGKPFLAYIHACRATRLNKVTRQELAEASNHENYAEGAGGGGGGSSRNRRPGGKSRFMQKRPNNESA